MTTQWERNIDSFQRLQTDLGFTDTLRVYNATTSYSSDTGDTTKTYTEVSNSPIDAEIVPPSEAGRQELAGTELDADAVIYVTDEVDIEWREYGEPSEAATEVGIRNGLGYGFNYGSDYGGTLERYRVQTVANEQNGMLRIEVTEL